MTTDNTQSELDVILAMHGAEPGEMTHSLKQAILDWHHKQTNEAIYLFHGFVMDADIIRQETDQAFNYGRLHKAIDEYIVERNSLKELEKYE